MNNTNSQQNHKESLFSNSLLDVSTQSFLKLQSYDQSKYKGLKDSLKENGDNITKSQSLIHKKTIIRMGTNVFGKKSDIKRASIMTTIDDNLSKKELQKLMEVYSNITIFSFQLFTLIPLFIIDIPDNYQYYWQQFINLYFIKSVILVIIALTLVMYLRQQFLQSQTLMPLKMLMEKQQLKEICDQTLVNKHSSAFDQSYNNDFRNIGLTIQLEQLNDNNDKDLDNQINNNILPQENEIKDYSYGKTTFQDNKNIQYQDNFYQAQNNQNKSITQNDQQIDRTSFSINVGQLYSNKKKSQEDSPNNPSESLLVQSQVQNVNEQLLFRNSQRSRRFSIQPNQITKLEEPNHLLSPTHHRQSIFNKPTTPIFKHQYSIVKYTLSYFNQGSRRMPSIEEKDSFEDSSSQSSDSCSYLSQSQSFVTDSPPSNNSQNQDNNMKQKSTDQLYANQKSIVSKELAGYQQDDKIKIKDKESIEIQLDMFGLSFLSIIILAILYQRQNFLSQEYVGQFALYVFIYYLTERLLLQNQLRYMVYGFCFCSLQYSFIDLSVKLQTRLIQVLISIFFVYNISQYQKLEINTHNSSKEDKDSIKKQMTKIIQNDSYMKNLIHMIPYGIAVLNMKDVSHFNKPFQKELGISKQRQIMKTLEKFQRKSKIKDKDNESQTKASAIDLIKQIDENAPLKSITNLKKDLQYIIKHQQQAFKNTKNIFETYFIEEEDQFHHSNNESSSQFHKPARKFYSVSISPINWNEKDCLLITVKDITLDKIIDQKQVLDRLKNMIFKSFTHELKTPLNGIIMSLETSHFISQKLISKLESPKEQLQVQDVLHNSQLLSNQLEKIESCAFILKNIMHDFFDYHQLQNNELVLNIKEFDLNEFISTIKNIIVHQLQTNSIKFICKVEQQNNGLICNNNRKLLRMLSDKERLQQILLNLLMNSLKFTQKGIISLEVYINHENIVKFKVKDTGIGIEETRLPYIFNLFEIQENKKIQTLLDTQFKCKLKIIYCYQQLQEWDYQQVKIYVNQWEVKFQSKVKLVKGHHLCLSYRQNMINVQINYLKSIFILERDKDYHHSEISILSQGGRSFYKQQSLKVSLYQASVNDNASLPGLDIDSHVLSSNHGQSVYDKELVFQKATSIGGFSFVFKQDESSFKNKQKVDSVKKQFFETPPLAHSKTTAGGKKHKNENSKLYIDDNIVSLSVKKIISSQNSQVQYENNVTGFGDESNKFGGSIFQNPYIEQRKITENKEEDQIESERINRQEHRGISFTNNLNIYDDNNSSKGYNNKSFTNTFHKKTKLLDLEEFIKKSINQSNKIKQEEQNVDVILREGSEEQFDSYSFSSTQQFPQQTKTFKTLITDDDNLSLDGDSPLCRMYESQQRNLIASPGIEISKLSNYNENSSSLNASQNLDQKSSLSLNQFHNSERKDQQRDSNSSPYLKIYDNLQKQNEIMFQFRQEKKKNIPCTKYVSFQELQMVEENQQNSQQFSVREINMNQEQQNMIDSISNLQQQQEEQKQVFIHTVKKDSSNFSFEGNNYFDQIRQQQSQSQKSSDKNIMSQNISFSGLPLEETQKQMDYLYISPKITRPNTPSQENENKTFDIPQIPQQRQCCPEVFIVDDVQMNRYVVETMLLFIFEFRVLQAQNGQECIDKLQQFYQQKQCQCNGIQLILMDIEMPIMNGIDATKFLVKLMKDKLIPEIPIVALTAYLDEMKNCKEAGMKDFMNKPASKSDLQEVLEKFNVSKNFIL